MESELLIDGKATGPERISRVIGHRILAGEFVPGAPLREADLSREYGVSRHVIREVLRRLVADGLAEYSSFKGVRVPLLSTSDIEDIYRARRFLECGALSDGTVAVNLQDLANIHSSFVAAVAAEEWNDAFACDVEFHSSIVKISGSTRLALWHRELMQSLKLAHLVVPNFQAEGLIRSVPQHADIIIALAAADIARARHALHAHLDDAECLLIRGMDNTEPSGRRRRASKPLS